MQSTKKNYKINIEKKKKTLKKLKKSTKLVQAPTQTVQVQLKMFLGGGNYTELTEWKDSKMVDLRLWETETKASKTRVSLRLIQWKTLCTMVDTIDDKVAKLKDKKSEDWK